MSSPLRIAAVLIVSLVALASCGGDDAAVDCELGNEITADFEALDSADAPAVESLQAIRDKMADFDAPDEIADDVDTVSDSLGVFIEELESSPPDVEAIQAAGEAAEEPSQNIENYLEENCS